MTPCLIIYYPCLDQKTKSKLQKIQNCCCRFIFKLCKYDHISTKINELKWLRVENIFQYHLSMFAFKMFLTNQPLAHGAQMLKSFLKI
jgi:hypothetical protein